MQAIIKLTALLLLMATNLSCSSDANQYDLVDDFPIPEGAQEVKKLDIGTTNTQQLFFQVNEPYPSTRVIDMYREHLNESGWKQCSAQTHGWSSHEDQSSDQHLLVHKLADYWVDQGGSKLLILSVMYYSTDLTKKNPDNDEQRVIIWVQQVSDLNEELSMLQVICK